jgi:hypothetical protein
MSVPHWVVGFDWVWLRSLAAKETGERGQGAFMLSLVQLGQCRDNDMWLSWSATLQSCKAADSSVLQQGVTKLCCAVYFAGHVCGSRLHA